MRRWLGARRQAGVDVGAVAVHLERLLPDELCAPFVEQLLLRLLSGHREEIFRLGRDQELLHRVAPLAAFQRRRKKRRSVVLRRVGAFERRRVRVVLLVDGRLEVPAVDLPELRRLLLAAAVVGVDERRVVDLVVVVDVAGRLRPLEQGLSCRHSVGVGVVVSAGFVDLADPEFSVGNLSGATDDG